MQSRHGPTLSKKGLVSLCFCITKNYLIRNVSHNHHGLIYIGTGSGSMMLWDCFFTSCTYAFEKVDGKMKSSSTLPKTSNPAVDTIS